MPSDSNNWCPEIYRTVYLDRHNDTHVRVAPCCQARAETEPVDTFDFDNSPYLRRLRDQFDAGEKPAACDACWKVEEHGHKSRRHSSIEFFENLNIKPDNTVKLYNIDYTVTWACNLACVMCGSHSSSLWAKQENLNKQQLMSIGRQFQKNNTALDRLNIENLQQIHFNGGEPLLNNDQLAVLTRLQDQKVLENVFVSYNTNGTVMPDEKIIKLWEQARLVKLFFSIDATESAFEYIRWPASWQQTSNNMLAMRESLPGNVMFGFNVTVGSYNIMEIADVYRWFADNLSTNRFGDASDFCWQFANNFDPKSLPAEVKTRAMNKMFNIPVLEGIVRYLDSTMYCEDVDWIKRLDAIDAKRNTKWREHLQVGKYF